MYAADDMNLIRQMEKTEPEHIYAEACTPDDFSSVRRIHAYIGTENRLLLICDMPIAQGDNVWFASVSDVTDEAQTTVLADSLLHDTYPIAANRADFLKFLGITEKQLAYEWIDMTDFYHLTDPCMDAEDYAAQFREYHFRTASEATVRTADGDYLANIQYYQKLADFANGTDDENAFRMLYAGLNQVVRADLCLTISPEPAIRDAYIALRAGLPVLGMKARRWLGR